ncbi:hypothetical protein ACTXT7_003997 [Hymenolepis weldensis]
MQMLEERKLLKIPTAVWGIYQSQIISPFLDKPRKAKLFVIVGEVNNSVHAVFRKVPKYVCQEHKLIWQVKEQCPNLSTQGVTQREMYI